MIERSARYTTTDSQTAGDAAVIELASWRRRDDVLTSISLVFGGVHYGTLPVDVPYTRGKPLVLYFVGRDDDGELAGPVDCLVTDDPALGAALERAR